MSDSTTAREWVSVSSAIALVVVLGVIPKTANLARGLGIFFIVMLLLEAKAITRLQSFVQNLGSNT